MKNTEAEKAYEDIMSRCRDLIDGRFIMSSKNIGNLLKSVVANQESYGYLYKCNEVYSYKNELKLALQHSNFVLPINKGKIVVLVTGLLRQFLLYESGDKDGFDFYLFLRKYYPAIDIDKSFSLFIDGVISPYAKAFKGMVDDEGVYIDEIEESNELGEELSISVKEQLYPCISKLSDQISSANGINPTLKKEYLTMLDGLNYVLELGNTKLLKVVYIGLKHTMSSYRDGEAHMKFIEDTLTAYRML